MVVSAVVVLVVDLHALRNGAKHVFPDVPMEATHAPNRRARAAIARKVRPLEVVAHAAPLLDAIGDDDRALPAFPLTLVHDSTSSSSPATSASARTHPRAVQISWSGVDVPPILSSVSV